MLDLFSMTFKVVDLVKEEIEKLEIKIKELIKENEELKEKIVELENKLENLEDYYMAICEDCDYRINYYEK